MTDDRDDMEAAGFAEPDDHPIAGLSVDAGVTRSAMPATAGILRSQFTAAVEAWGDTPGALDDLEALAGAFLAIVEPVLAEITRLRQDIADRDATISMLKDQVTS